MKILETDRLILRTFRTTDLDQMTLIDQDPKVCQYLAAIGTRSGTTENQYRLIPHQQSHSLERPVLNPKSIILM